MRLAFVSMKGKQIRAAYLTVDEAARLVSVSHWTVRSWLHKGLLTRYKRAFRTVISRSELLALVKPHPEPKGKAQ